MSVIDLYDDIDDPTIQAQLATARQDRELYTFEKSIDVRKLALQINGRSDIRVEDSIISGDIVQTIIGASQITFIIHDQARNILRSRRLEDEDRQLRAIDIKVDGVWWRLVKSRKQGDDLVLTFELRNIARLRTRGKARVIGARKNITRAQAILYIIRLLKRDRPKVHINELKKKQPIKRATKKDRKDIRDRKRSKGFDDGTVLEGKEGPLNASQLNNASRALAVADELKAPELATLALLVACMIEGPDFKNPKDGEGTSVGMLQLTDDHYGGDIAKRRDIDRICTQFLKGPAFTGGPGAIALARAHPTWKAGRIAQTIQGSGYGDRYNTVLPQARALLEEWGGTAGTSAVFKKYVFRIEKKETLWDAIQRLAKEVEWRAFFVGEEFYYISEEDLYKSRARFTIEEGKDGVTNIDFDQDYRKKVQKATITCRIDRWRCPPGTVVLIKGMGSMNGRYLVEEISRNVYSPEATITAKRPTKERKEPRNEVRNQGEGAQVADPGVITTDGGAKGIVDQAVTVAQANGGSGVYVGSSLRKGSTTTSGNASDHSQNNAYKAARDIGVRGIDLLVGPPSHKLDKAIIALGEVFDRDYGNGKHRVVDTFHWRGYRIQIIWRTPEYGGHMGHIHIGAMRLGDQRT